jgi:phage gpG-like protein
MTKYIEVKNVKQVKGWIGTELSTTEKSMRKLMSSVALVIMDAAKRAAPVITGRYRSSIHIEYGGGGQMSGATDLSGTKWTERFSQQPADDEIFVGTNVVYAEKVEKKHQTLENATNDGQFYLTRKINELANKRH